MRKTLIAALMVTAGLGADALGQYVYNFNPRPANKVGLLSVALQNQYQLYWTGGSDFTKAGTFGVMTNIPGLKGKYLWSDQSYRHLMNCLGEVIYKSGKGKVDNKRIIAAINAGLSYIERDARGQPVSYGLFVNPDADNIYRGALSTANTKLVLAHYSNEEDAPPYPPNMDVYWNGRYLVDPASGLPDVWQSAWWNSPWAYEGQYDFLGVPMAFGDTFNLYWFNKQLNAWGKPRTEVSGETGLWTWDYEIAPLDPVFDPTPRIAKPGTQVFAIDPSNPNPNLRCFDVTPFFAFEEAVCQFCWDTMDRVTDGNIIKGEICEGCVDLPCYTDDPSFLCTVKGKGTTKFFLTMKFNNANVSPDPGVNGGVNRLLERYYVFIVGGPRLIEETWVTQGVPLTWGWKLDPADVVNSALALNFEVSGIVTYTWQYKAIDTEFGKLVEAMGKMSMNAQGHGWTPMCGVLNGPVSITDVSRVDKQFKGQAWCVNGNFPWL